MTTTTTTTKITTIARSKRDDRALVSTIICFQIEIADLAPWQQIGDFDLKSKNDADNWFRFRFRFGFDFGFDFEFDSILISRQIPFQPATSSLTMPQRSNSCLFRTHPFLYPWRRRDVGQGVTTSGRPEVRTSLCLMATRSSRIRFFFGRTEGGLPRSNQKCHGWGLLFTARQLEFNFESSSTWSCLLWLAFVCLGMCLHDEVWNSFWT